MPWTRVFISHSTKTERAQSFVDAIGGRLTDTFAVDLDQAGLAPGDDWRERIYSWMDRAHAAVLIITPEALRSEFVAIEASVVSWRQFRHPDFVLIPVLVDVGVEALKTGVLGELDLQRLQAVSGNSPEETAEKVMERLQPLAGLQRPRTPAEILQANVAKELRAGNAEVSDLREVGTQLLGWNEADFGANMDLFEEFSRSLLASRAVVAYRAVLALSVRGVRTARALLNLTAPIWVGEASAQPVAYQARAARKHRVLVLNCARSVTDSGPDWTLDSYINRAYYRAINHHYKWCMLAPPRDEDPVEDLKSQILAAFRPRNRYAAHTPALEVKQLIERRDEEAHPVFAVFLGWLPDPPTLRELREEFETVTFFILASNQPAERLRALSDPGRLLHPVDSATATDAFQVYTIIYDDVCDAWGETA